MAERTAYAPGTPSWVDMGSPDPHGAAAFYSALFGWTVDEAPQEEAGGYMIATLRGKSVAGIGPQMNQGMPPYWGVYVSVVDVDASVARATVHGATVLAGPMDVLDAGRMAVLQDSVGSFVSMWQAGAHIGAELVNEPGTFTWNELATTNLVGAREFYTAVFNWDVDASSSESGTIYTLDGNVVCGAHAAGEGEFPAWSVWFAVADCDASAAKVTELGGTVIMPPSDMDFGRGSVVADPYGAVFGIAVVADMA
ncbi:MAG TPA: VOC family protein [Ilumatobacteraceae bacterium]